MCLYIEVPAATQQGYVEAGDLLRVLSAPARLAIVVELASGALQVNELVDRLELSQPLVSQHLRVLRGARLGRGQAERSGSHLLTGRPARRSHRGRRHPARPRGGHPRSGGSSTRGGHDTMSEHTVHEDHPHEHGPSCGHVTVAHGDHADYIHDGHTHSAHDGHYDERPLAHLAHQEHDHVHGEGCGHAAITQSKRRLRPRRAPPHVPHEGHYDSIEPHQHDPARTDDSGAPHAGGHMTSSADFEDPLPRGRRGASAPHRAAVHGQTPRHRRVAP